MEKIKLIITYQHVHIGGATTSLINFLQALDYSKYEVDLLFYENDHSIDDKLPKEVNILPQGKIHEKFGIKNILAKIMSPSYMIAKVHEIYLRKIKGNDKAGIQVMSKQGCRYSRKFEKEYDVAVSYDMNWPFNYMMKYIKAKKFILWMHLDFHASGLSFEVDKKFLEKTDKLVFVSEQCKDNFVNAHKEFENKSIYMPNLMATKAVKMMAQMEDVTLPFEKDDLLTMVTVARIDFPHKGLDRGVKAISKLRKEGKNIRWIIIGGGPDREELEAMIKSFDLEDCIYYIGEKKNPIPYLKMCDIFFLPSLFEGKPMAVTEAQMMGLVPVVCHYASADEQVEHNVDGLVLENSEEGIYKGLDYVIGNKEEILKMKETVGKRDYGNEYEIRIFEELIEEIL